MIDPSQKEKQAQQDLRQAVFFDFLCLNLIFSRGNNNGTLNPLYLGQATSESYRNAPIKIGESFSSNKLVNGQKKKRISAGMENYILLYMASSYHSSNVPRKWI